MSLTPEQLHLGRSTASFQLLFLAEGFLASDREEFLTHCANVTAALLELDPFKQSQGRFAVWAVFTPSNQRGIASVPTDSAFKFILANSRELRTRHPGRIISVLHEIQPIALGGDTAVLPPVTAADIWLEGDWQGSRALCVIVRYDGKCAATQFEYAAGEFDEPTSDNDELRALTPFIAISMWPHLTSTYPNYSNWAQANASVLARELGASLGLGYEAEQTDADHEEFAPPLIEPDAPNLTADFSIRKTPLDVVDVNKLKWRELVPITRWNRIVEIDHPTEPVPGEPPAAEAARYEPIQQEMSDGIVVLRHPKSPSNPPDTSSLTAVRYITPGKLKVLDVQPHLIEGGGGFRRGIYRPSVECLMRFEGIDATTARGTNREIIPYCSVCREYLSQHFESLQNFRFGGVHILRGQRISPRQLVRSRLADAFVAYVRNTPLPQPMVCVEATTYRFASFLIEALGWTDLTQIDLSASTSWYQNPVVFPAAKGVPAGVWNIWMSALDKLRGSRHLLTYAGLGAAGALWYAGFASLANRRRLVVEQAGGKTFRFRFAVGLQKNDLDSISPGSLLQLWPSEGFYRDLVRYTAGALGAPPPGIGHSVIYMGKNAASEHTIADQTGVDKPFITGWGSWLPFWVGAQWYDANNVPTPVKSG
ncbi:MAG: M64 family metallopeptidase [Acidobacteriia bacterium]|nr:M64 family metallopeptidase [Terriglobia bacterium]